MKGYINYIGGALLFALIVIGISNYNKYKHNYEEQSSLITAFQDSIKYYKDKDGKNSAQIAVLEGSKENLLHIIGKSDLQLAKLIKKGASSGTIFQQTTKFDTVVLVKRDTIDGRISYDKTIVNNWMRLHVGLKDDSLTTSVQFKDSISVSFQKVRQGFLKRRKSVVIVTNANPYVKTESVHSFDIPEKKSKITPWIQIGLGAGITYLLIK
jgi:hypothetical protein